MAAMRFIMRFIATALGVWLVTALPLDVLVEGGDGSGFQRVLVFLGVAGILTLVNGLVKPVVNFFTLPVRVLTLGLFSLVVSWAMLTLTAWITSKFSFGTLEVGGFWKTLLAALVIAIITGVFGKVVPKRGSK
jgi:putative membrane protein